MRPVRRALIHPQGLLPVRIVQRVQEMQAREAPPPLRVPTALQVPIHPQALRAVPPAPREPLIGRLHKVLVPLVRLGFIQRPMVRAVRIVLAVPIRLRVQVLALMPVPPVQQGPLIGRLHKVLVPLVR